MTRDDWEDTSGDGVKDVGGAMDRADVDADEAAGTLERERARGRGR